MKFLAIIHLTLLTLALAAGPHDSNTSDTWHKLQEATLGRINASDTFSPWHQTACVFHSPFRNDVSSRNNPRSSRSEKAWRGDLDRNLQTALASEVDYLTSDFQQISRLLNSLFHGDELQANKYDAAYLYIERSFRDALLEKTIKHGDPSLNADSLDLDSLVAAVFADLNRVKQVHNAQAPGRPNTSHSQKDVLVIEAEEYVLSLMNDRAQTYERSLLQFLHHRRNNPEAVFADNGRMSHDIRSLQSQFDEYKAADSSNSETLAYRIDTIAQLHEWVSRIGSDPRALLRVDGILADRIDEKLESIEQCLHVLGEFGDQQITDRLTSETTRIAGEIRLYGFCSDPFTDLIVRKLHSIIEKLERVNPSATPTESRNLFTDIATRAMLNNFKKAYVKLKAWTNGDLAQSALGRNVESLRAQMRVWVCDLQQWNLTHTPAIADVHELGYRVAKGLLTEVSIH